MKKETLQLMSKRLDENGLIKGYVPPEGSEGQRSLAAVFRQLDADGSGAIDLAEMKHALAALGLKKVDAEEALKGFDTDGDGVVSLHEWEKNMHPKTREVRMYSRLL